MKTRTPRMVAFFCAVALALPSPTFAFHPIESSEGRQHAGLEHSLQSSGLEEQIKGQRLADAVGLDKLVVHYSAGVSPDFSAASVVLVTADAGMGTRFSPSGEQLKMLALVGGLPAGVRTKLAARQLGWSVISVVGHRKKDVMAAYSQHHPGIIFVEADNPTGGTGYAIYHAAAVKGLKESNALIIATMGDQPLFDREVLEAVEQRFHQSGADLVIASAIFPGNAHGKGRIVRDRDTRQVLGILEQKDIDQGTTSLGGYSREELEAISEGNVSIYAMRANRLFQLLADTRNDNAQGQFYLPDIVKMVIEQRGRVEVVQIDPEKALDLTTREDLARVESYLARTTQKIGFNAWMATFGSWGPTRRALKKRFDESTTRQILRNEINRLVRELVRQEINPRVLLREFIPRMIQETVDLIAVRRDLNAITELGRRVAAAVVSLIGVTPLNQTPFSWYKFSGRDFADLAGETVRFVRKGRSYTVSIDLESGHTKEVPSGPGFGDFVDVYVMDTSQRIRLIPGEPLMLDQFGEGHAGLEEKTVTAERVQTIPRINRVMMPQFQGRMGTATSQEVEPLRFVVDTSRGDERVLRLLELAIQVHLETGLPIDASGVATAEQLAAAKEQMTDRMTRLVLEHSVFTYTPGDDESHRVALEQAKNHIAARNLPLEFVITQINGNRVQWFLREINRLGVRDLNADLMEQVDIFLEAA